MAPREDVSSKYTLPKSIALISPPLGFGVWGFQFPVSGLVVGLEIRGKGLGFRVRV
jgi:hypothetical protein